MGRNIQICFDSSQTVLEHHRSFTTFTHTHTHIHTHTHTHTHTLTHTRAHTHTHTLAHTHTHIHARTHRLQYLKKCLLSPSVSPRYYPSYTSELHGRLSYTRFQGRSQWAGPHRRKDLRPLLMILVNLLV